MRVSPIPWLPSWFFSALAVNPDTDTSLRLPLLCGPSSFVFVHACMLCVCAQSCLTGTPWTAALQAPLSMEFSRPEYWSGLPFPSPEDLPNPGMELRSPTLQSDSLPSEPPGKPGVFLFITTCLKERILSSVPQFDSRGKNAY